MSSRDHLLKLENIMKDIPYGLSAIHELTKVEKQKPEHLQGKLAKASLKQLLAERRKKL